LAVWLPRHVFFIIVNFLGDLFVRKTKLAAEEREKSQLREVLMLLKRMNHWA